MKLRLAVVVGVAVILLQVPGATAQEKPDDVLAKALKEGDLLFTAKVGKVNPLGQTDSIPPSTFGNVTFKDMKALRGKVPDSVTFAYSFREGTTKNLDLEAIGEVLVAVKGKAVSVLVPATDANRALARKVSEASKDQ